MRKSKKNLKLSNADKKTIENNHNICTEMGGKACENIVDKEKAP